MSLSYAAKWVRVYPRYRWTRYDVLVRRGGIATLLFFLFVLILAFTESCVERGDAEICGSRASVFFNSPPNEVGDTLAGIAGALAFLWIIVTVMLQSKELGAQRQELRLARRESAKMAAALEAQADIFRDEQKARDQDRAKALLWEQLRGISDLIDQSAQKMSIWRTFTVNHSIGSGLTHQESKKVKLFPTASDLSKDDHIKCAVRKVASALEELSELKGRLEHKPARLEELNDIVIGLKSVLKTVNRASEDQAEFVRNLGISSFLSHLETILEDDELWAVKE